MYRASALSLVLFLLAGCSDSPVAPTSAAAPQFSATQSHTVTQLGPLDFSVDVPCANGGAGETVTASGVTLQFLDGVTRDANGGVHVQGYVKPIGNWDGIGEVTGDRYQATGLTTDFYNYDSKDGFPGEETYVNNFNWIGPGTGNNVLIHENYHITFNANGDMTVEVDNFWSECR